MPSFGSTVYLRCNNCRHTWSMNYFNYLYHFIIRKCPNCNYHDLLQSLDPTENKKEKAGITLEKISY